MGPTPRRGYMANMHPALAQTRSLLAEHDLPPLLLPEEVTHCEFCPESRILRVRIGCRVSTRFEGIPVRYATEVVGRLRSGGIEGLLGVKARLPIWLPITALRRDGATISFAVGPVSKRLALASFQLPGVGIPDGGA